MIKKKNSKKRNQKLSFGWPFSSIALNAHASETSWLPNRGERDSNDWNGYVTIVVTCSLLDSFHRCNSSRIGCFVGCRYCFVHPFVHPWYIICFLCSSPGFLIQEKIKDKSYANSHATVFVKRYTQVPFVSVIQPRPKISLKVRA